jgi:hypothetical protein
MATEQNLNTFFAKLPGGLPIDKDATANAFKSWASFNERFAGIAIDTASRTNEIATNTTQESLSHLRDLTKVHDEPGDYGQAFATYLQGQLTLTRDTAEAFGEVFNHAREQAAELLSQAGETAKDTGEANTRAAARKTTAKAKQAVSNVEETVDENA